MNPEEDLQEATVEEAVASLMSELPAPVQDFLKSDERGEIVRELAGKYSLHVDQAGEFERAFLFMLLGILKPEEFVSTLAASGFSQEAINGLAADVNTRVFMRLRDAERTRTAPAAPTPAKPASIPPPAIEYTPPQTQTTLPGSPEPAPMPQPVTPPDPVAAQPVPVSVEATPVHIQPTPQQHLVHAMPNAPQSGWHPAAAVHIFVPTHGAHSQPAAPMTPQVPAQPAQEVSVPVPPPQPAPVPYVNPAPVIPQTQLVSPPIHREYAADPYREPIQ